MSFRYNSVRLLQSIAFLSNQPGAVTLDELQCPGLHRSCTWGLAMVRWLFCCTWAHTLCPFQSAASGLAGWQDKPWLCVARGLTHCQCQWGKSLLQHAAAFFWILEHVTFGRANFSFLFAPAIQEACMSSDAQGHRRNCATQSYTEATCAKQPCKVPVPWISNRLSTRCWGWFLYASPTVNQRPKRMLWAETSCLCQRYCSSPLHHEDCFLFVSLLKSLWACVPELNKG